MSQLITNNKGECILAYHNKTIIGGLLKKR